MSRNLLAETADLHAERWSDPPGSRWIAYARHRDCFQTTFTRKPRRAMTRRYTVARFALDGKVLPLVQQTLSVAESFRRQLMGKYGRIRENDQPVTLPQAGAVRFRSEAFSGKDASGQKLVDSHRHAYYLPSDEDDDGRVDHLTVVAEMGFDPDEVRALDRLRLLRLGDGDPLNLLLVSLDEAPPERGPLFKNSRCWVSATPFLSTRHPKRRGLKRDPAHMLGEVNRDAFLRVVLLEELERLRQRRPELPTAIDVQPLPDHRIGVRKLRPIQFRRFRQKAGDDGGRRPSGAFRILFPVPVAGPISLGHSSHFGLGMFVANQEP